MTARHNTNTSLRVFTPRLRGTGERLRLELDANDWIIATRYHGTRKTRGVVTDQRTGKRYSIKGASCGLPCFCDAIATET